MPPNGFVFFPPACFYAVGNLSGALTGKILDNNSIILNYFPATPRNFHFSAHFLAATGVTMHNEGRIFFIFFAQFFCGNWVTMHNERKQSLPLGAR